ncbi:hypothetical protein SAMN02910275_00157 [Butyrivibrio sp. INlla18]|uniref:ABC-three component system protein n=1 Tax=Butyrivibrio sp. INlla18 TaxID=1520806 RepID=UPI00088FAB5E|nr:ABC-three component system protein [Butyrivibrio sp. INlla18]SDA39032.1 hypothetical protein SAMN02910275_00157 [Butyrivibrio sp. INlla18]
MELCAGTLLTVLKRCKSSRILQKEFGTEVFKAIQPDFDMNDDDSAISAVFRGARNLDTFIRINYDEMTPTEVALRFNEHVVPMLDRNKWNGIVCALKQIIKDSDIDKDTVIEFINGLKCGEILEKTDIVFSEFLAGILLYVVRHTDNLNRQSIVKEITSGYVDEAEKKWPRINFVETYSLDCLDAIGQVINDAEAVNMIVQEGGNCVVCGKPLEKDNITKAVCSDGTSFLVCIGCSVKIMNASKTQIEEYKNIKQQLKTNMVTRSRMSENHLGDDVRLVIRAVSKMDMSTLTPSRMNPITVEQKVSDAQLRRSILHDVNDCYSDVDAIIAAEAAAGRLNVRTFEKVIKRMYEDRDETASQSDVYNTLVELIYEQTGRISREASRILVSYFVQRCEVFG